METKRGLKERIQYAESQVEIEALLTEGQSYVDVSLKTRQRWQRVAGRRLKQLNAVK